MPEPICKAQGKIRAAKHWLTRAEKHFDLNSPVRGQMDLLLAEAELRSTRETVGSRPSWFKLNWGIQFVALSLAAILVVAGVSSVWWVDAKGTVIPAPQTAAPPLPMASVPVQNSSAAPVRSVEPPAATVVETTIVTQEVKKTEKSTAPDTALSPEEMKRLIQTAGQTLRGRAKP